MQTAARLLLRTPLGSGELTAHMAGLPDYGDNAPVLIASLLGPDPRFRIDPDGRWQLDETLAAVDSSLGFLDYAVVDVETTGGRYEDGHRIIELAIVELREGVVTREYRSLVNPGRDITPRVSRLTGITEAMVADAPRFADIADEVYKRLEHRVFAAHNVDHDWAFVAGQLRDARTEAPPAARICTEKLSRRLLSSQRRHHLDALCGRFGIRVYGRHRALGDARAAADILVRLLDEAERRGMRDLQGLGELLSWPPRDVTRFVDSSRF